MEITCENRTFTFEEVGSIPTYSCTFQFGKAVKTIGIRLKEIRVDGARIIYNWIMTLEKDSNGYFIDFSKTRLKDFLGNIYLQDLSIPMKG